VFYVCQWLSTNVMDINVSIHHMNQKQRIIGISFATLFTQMCLLVDQWVREHSNLVNCKVGFVYVCFTTLVTLEGFLTLVRDLVHQECCSERKWLASHLTYMTLHFVPFVREIHSSVSNQSPSKWIQLATVIMSDFIFACLSPWPSISDLVWKTLYELHLNRKEYHYPLYRCNFLIHLPHLLEHLSTVHWNIMFLVPETASN